MRSLVVLSLSMLAITADPAAAQKPLRGPARGAFITRLGKDTLYVERYTRDATKLEGDVAFFNPATRVAHYRVDFAPDGRFLSFQIETRDPQAAADQPPPFHRTGTLKDSVLTSTVRQRVPRDTTIESQGIVHGPVVPFMSVGHAVYEQVLLHALASGKDSVQLEMFGAGQQPVFPVYVKRLGGDSVVIDWGFPLRARVTRDGRLLSLDQSATTVKTVAERVGSVDLDKIVKRHLELERTAGRAGLPSPRDTVRASIAGATMWIDYGRPSLRGRKIFGSVVPLDSVWRTGANAATQIESSRDLVLRDAKGAETVVPAGRYTLWSIPGGANGPTLIINKQVGQWGTQYDAAQDVVRVPLKVASVSSPVEKFTIAVTPREAGGVIRLAWEDREYTLPFAVR